eukprot:scaffold12235_cov117-Isochrysis_galbana.AAC.5
MPSCVEVCLYYLVGHFASVACGKSADCRNRGRPMADRGPPIVQNLVHGPHGLFRAHPDPKVQLPRITRTTACPRADRAAQMAGLSHAPPRARAGPGGMSTRPPSRQSLGRPKPALGRPRGRLAPPSD